MKNNTITIIELENHINKWFGSNWSNQSGGQVYAMVIELLAKVGTEIIEDSVDDRTTEYFIERESTERDVVEHFSKDRKPGDRYS